MLKQIQLYEDTSKLTVEEASDRPLVALQITSYGKSWVLRRSYEHFRLLDEQLHRCIYDRKFSQLPLLPDEKSLLNNTTDRPEVIYFVCYGTFWEDVFGLTQRLSVSLYWTGIRNLVED